MFNIDYANNRLDVFIGGTNASYTFGSGNYNANTFMSKFITVMGSQWRISLDEVSNVFNISNTLLPFTILATSSLDYVMGFNTNIASSTSSLGNTAIMSRTCNFLQIPRINLKCSQLANSYQVGTSNCYNDIIVSIPNDTSINGKIVYRNLSQISCPLDHLESLTGFQVCFCDDQNNLINFNGLACYFTFQFDIYRKPIQKNITFRELMDKLNPVMN